MKRNMPPRRGSGQVVVAWHGTGNKPHRTRSGHRKQMEAQEAQGAGGRGRGLKRWHWGTRGESRNTTCQYNLPHCHSC
jgi:hypothetical protein